MNRVRVPNEDVGQTVSRQATVHLEKKRYPTLPTSIVGSPSLVERRKPAFLAVAQIPLGRHRPLPSTSMSRTTVLSRMTTSAAPSAASAAPSASISRQTSTTATAAAATTSTSAARRASTTTGPTQSQTSPIVFPKPPGTLRPISTVVTTTQTNAPHVRKRADTVADAVPVMEKTGKKTTTTSAKHINRTSRTDLEKQLRKTGQIVEVMLMAHERRRTVERVGYVRLLEDVTMEKLLARTSSTVRVQWLYHRGDLLEEWSKPGRFKFLKTEAAKVAHYSKYLDDVGFHDVSPFAKHLVQATDQSLDSALRVWATDPTHHQTFPVQFITFARDDIQPTWNCDVRAGTVTPLCESATTATVVATPTAVVCEDATTPAPVTDRSVEDGDPIKEPSPVLKRRRLHRIAPDTHDTDSSDSSDSVDEEISPAAASATLEPRSSTLTISGTATNASATDSLQSLCIPSTEPPLITVEAVEAEDDRDRAHQRLRKQLQEKLDALANEKKRLEKVLSRHERQAQEEKDLQEQINAAGAVNLNLQNCLNAMCASASSSS